MPHFKAVAATTQSKTNHCGHMPSLKRHNPLRCAVLRFYIRGASTNYINFEPIALHFFQFLSKWSFLPALAAVVWYLYLVSCRTGTAGRSPARKSRICQQIIIAPSMVCTTRVSFSPKYVESGFVGVVDWEISPDIPHLVESGCQHTSINDQPIPTHQRATRERKEKLPP